MNLMPILTAATFALPCPLDEMLRATLFSSVPYLPHGLSFKDLTGSSK
jgi:hypothetical protein